MIVRKNIVCLYIIKELVVIGNLTIRKQSN